MFGDTIFYVGKKNYEEKAFSMYAAYTYPQGICAYWNTDKEALKLWLEDNIDKIELELTNLKPEDYL